MAGYLLRRDDGAGGDVAFGRGSGVGEAFWASPNSPDGVFGGDGCFLSRFVHPSTAVGSCVEEPVQYRLWDAHSNLCGPE